MCKEIGNLVKKEMRGRRKEACSFILTHCCRNQRILIHATDLYAFLQGAVRPTHLPLSSILEALWSFLYCYPVEPSFSYMNKPHSYYSTSHHRIAQAVDFPTENRKGILGWDGIRRPSKGSFSTLTSKAMDCLWNNWVECAFDAHLV